MAEICWLASFPKSGNTWLRAFLVNYMRDPDTPIGINEVATLFYSDSQAKPYLEVSGKTTIADLTVAEVNTLRPKVQELFVRSSPDTVFVKTHNPVIVLDGTPVIDPKCTGGAIYLVRNPLDVATSYAHHESVTVDKMIDNIANDAFFGKQGGETAYTHLGNWSRHVDSWTRAPGMHLHVARYEDMVRAPTPTFEAILAFLGVPIERDRLAKALRFCSFRELAGQEAQEGFLEAKTDETGSPVKFFHKGEVGRWRDAMSDDQARRVIDTHREVMVRLGYLTADGELQI